jgi:RNA recognition motif-containing protein
VARQPSGFAFVEYEDELDAEDAIKAMDNAELQGHRLKVEMSEPELEPEPEPEPERELGPDAVSSELEDAVVLPESRRELRQLIAEARHFGLPELQTLAEAELAKTEAQAKTIQELQLVARGAFATAGRCRRYDRRLRTLHAASSVRRCL